MNLLGARNAISLVLLAVAIVGIVQQIDAARHGFDRGLQAHLVLAGYVLIALYAAASIAVRLRAGRRKN
jgi:hypothetical protein